VRRKKMPKKMSETPSKAVVAFASKTQFNLDKIAEAIQQKRLYEVMALSEDLEDVLYARSLYNEGALPRDLFLFSDGVVVCWNMVESEHKAILKLVDSSHLELADLYPKIERESDFLAIVSSQADHTSITKNGEVTVAASLESDETVLAKYAISNALAQSVKLAVWEEMLSAYIDSIQHIAEDLRMGRNPRLSQKDVLIKTGEFFALKHFINLDSDLLDIPDFYWDREDLEKIYKKAFYHLEISKRTSVMNVRLAHCVELTDMMSTNLSHNHSSRLEWIIILLIAVEVFIEVFRLTTSKKESEKVKEGKEIEGNVLGSQ